MLPFGQTATHFGHTSEVVACIVKIYSWTGIKAGVQLPGKHGNPSTDEPSQKVTDAVS